MHPKELAGKFSRHSFVFANTKTKELAYVNRSQTEIVVVVCTKDRPERVEVFIQHLSTLDIPPMSFLLVDSTSNSKHLEKNSSGINLLRSKGWHAVHLIDTPGLPHQRNTALDYVTKNLNQARFVAFLDDDILISRDYFDNVLAVFDSDPELVVVGGYDCGAGKFKPKQHPVLVSLSILPKKPGEIAKSGLSQVPRPEKDLELVDFVPGGMQTLRLSLLKDLRFNEESKFFGEDIEMHVRLSVAGKIGSSALLPVIHLEAKESKAGNGSQAIQEQIVRLRLHLLNPKKVSFFHLALGSVFVMMHDVGSQLKQLQFRESVSLAAQHLKGFYAVLLLKVSHEISKHPFSAESAKKTFSKNRKL